MPTILDQARQTVTDPAAPLTARQIAWMILKSARGQPVRQVAP